MADVSLLNRAARPDCWLGYTDLRCDDPRGQFYNWKTSRPMMVRADGTRRHDAAPMLANEPDTWAQFAGWSPDGMQAIVGRCWADPENYAWEREHRTFRFSQGWRVDSCLVTLSAEGEPQAATVPTAVESVSEYNAGLFFWPGDPGRLGFTALINDVSHPFSMKLDGTDKKDLTTGGAGFTYGYSASPDGKRITYHKDYQVYLADADGQNLLHVNTGDPFHFGPLWSPDGSTLVFQSGRHYDCDIFVVGADGKGARRIADRNGYRGEIEVLDTPDFHSASSDIPVWGGDSQWIYYTASVGQAVEMMRVSLAGRVEQLTFSKPGVLHYHPKVSPDGQWIAYGSTREGARALYVSRADGSDARAITEARPGRAQMHVHWQGCGE